MSIYPRVWLNFILPALRLHERMIIDAWRDGFKGNRAIIDDQLKRINMAQRLACGHVVDLYAFRYGILREDFPNRLPVRTRDARLGEVVVDIRNQRFTVEIWAADGCLFSLKFDKVPPRWASRGDVRIISVGADTLSPRELIKFLPDDYMDLARRSDEEFRTDNPILHFVVVPVDEIYSVATKHGSFWVLVIVHDIGVLGIRTTDEDRSVYLLYYDDRAPLRLSVLLEESILLASQRG